MLEVDIVKGIVETNVAKVACLSHGENLFQEKVINCTTVKDINSWDIVQCNSSRVRSHGDSFIC